MEWIPNWLALIPAVIALLIAWRSLRIADHSTATAERAIETTRAYKDPVFTLSFVPFALPTGDQGPDARVDVQMILHNKGESHAQNIRITADFDPFNVFFPAQETAHIDAGGHWTLPVIFNQAAVPREDNTLSRVMTAQDSAARLFTVEYSNLQGERYAQKTSLPPIHDYILYPPATQLSEPQKGPPPAGTSDSMQD